ncbi:MAG: response regulator [Lachnospiraceae bacterium]|nr:response regulator [Candidatus Colinaster scatohippi]
MIIYAIDDEQNALEYIMRKIQAAETDAEVHGFNNAKDALESAKKLPFDVAFMDIQMPEITGIELAKKFKKINPQANMVFVTGYSEYTMDAFSVDASGYLLKPATKDQVRHALDNLRYPISVAGGPKVCAQCFGDFEFFVNGTPVHFKYNKSKEVIAFLVDRRGAQCTNQEVIINLWEDDEDHSAYYRSLMKDIQDTFKELGIEDVFDRQRAGASIIADKIRCDYYDYLAGKPEGINAYKGEYMQQYSWAEETAGVLYDEM